MRSFSADLSSCPQLEVFDLSYNEIERLDVFLNNTPDLKVVSLTYNRLQEIPSCLENVKDKVRFLRQKNLPAEQGENRGRKRPADEELGGEPKRIKPTPHDKPLASIDVEGFSDLDVENASDDEAIS